ncbi:5-guanidino-2-oxopentanoate decarboxylase [Pimelobacter simplex]|uniref:5-guanidino-2-oxopentanoate decarboxylase n=1 Tax=Nocardioides simplex TaxID=2045 RepID=A0A7J5DX77_NOCSI|nr:5-guanidino-2-oxopentanoate decarboxylase [Pimelobacter simplex]KAB2810611.1 5-guanidino-2-oxopentanoate decarboxylase [Pimelobacter simplex]
MALMTGGEALVAALAAHGVEVAFGIPGTHNLEIYKHLPAHGVRHVSTRHEQGAGYAADGYARTTGRVGVAIVTSGPALLNAATAVGQAYSDSIPVLVVSPGLPLRHPATGNGLLHETRDQGAALAAVAAASLRPTSVAEIPTAVAQAFSIMTSGRPRPVHLEVPLDVLEETADVVLVAPVVAAPLAAPAASIAAAAGVLDGATAPLLVVGGGARGAASQVQALAERLGALVVSTTNGKGVLAEDHPLALGAGIHLPAIKALADEADVVVAIGTELAPADLWYGPLPVTGKLVRVDVDPVGMVTNAAPAVAVLGDAALALDALLEALGAGEPARPDAAAWRERKAKDAQAEGAEWLEVVAALAAAVPRDVVMATDNAMACYLGTLANLATHGPSSYLFPTGYGTLGFGLPAGIGAKVGNPDRPVVAMLGDGGVMFTVAELATAAELRIALPVVVVDNSGYGEIRNEMADRGDPVHAVTFPAPDFAALGRAVGCLGVTVDLGADGTPADLTTAVRDALVADRPTVIHVRMARDVSPEGGAR